MQAMSVRGRESFPGDAISCELANGDRLIDSRKVLENDAARPQIQMPDFRVAHLAFGQTNIRATSAEFAARIIAIELVVKGCSSQKRRVSVLLARFPAAGIDAPSITNDEHHRAGHMRALCRRL